MMNRAFRQLTGAVLMVALPPLLGACAGTGGERPQSKAVCSQCGEITSISPQDRRQSRMDSPMLADSPRLLQSRGKLGNSGLLAPNVPPALSMDVPVYEVDSVSRFARNYSIKLRMDDGRVEELLVDNPGTLQVGDRVRVVGNRLLPEGPRS